jgi:hypothetical protein
LIVDAAPETVNVLEVVRSIEVAGFLHPLGSSPSCKFLARIDIHVTMQAMVWVVGSFIRGHR